MKALHLLLTAATCFNLSCQKEAIGPKLKREAEGKLIGKWIMERRTTEVYTPIPAYPVPGTGTKTEYIGNSNDQFIFHQNNSLSIDTASAGTITQYFEVINPNQLLINNKTWRMDSLTSRQLVLISDKNDANQNARIVTKIMLKK
jgi:hypothetical protein